MHSSITEIRQLYANKGHERYDGEAVSQLDHALQCAMFAEAADQPPELITACLLHDLGHLLHNLGDHAAARGVDDYHEHRALPYLRSRFSSAVTEPIRLHVQAKRYLCATDSAYWSGLSAASQQSLQLQGGIFSAAEAQQFIAQPYSQDAVKLRRWDDQAKIVELETPDFEHFLPILEACIGSL